MVYFAPQHDPASGKRTTWLILVCTGTYQFIPSTNEYLPCYSMERYEISCFGMERYELVCAIPESPYQVWNSMDEYRYRPV
jgi:hypothetical protein